MDVAYIILNRLICNSRLGVGNMGLGCNNFYKVCCVGFFMKGKNLRRIMVGVTVGVVLFVAGHLNKYGGRYESLGDSYATVDLTSSGRTDPNVAGVKDFGLELGQDLDVRFMGYDSDGIRVKRFYVKDSAGEYRLRAEVPCEGVRSFGEIRHMPWGCLKPGTYDLKFEIEDVKGNLTSDLVRLVVE